MKIYIDWKTVRVLTTKRCDHVKAEAVNNSGSTKLRTHWKRKVPSPGQATEILAKNLFVTKIMLYVLSTYIFKHKTV